eukprot:4543194-Amphidinium_carterae.1
MFKDCRTVLTVALRCGHSLKTLNLAGWSSPSPSALGPHCLDYTSLDTLRKYYSNFLWLA